MVLRDIQTLDVLLFFKKKILSDVRSEIRIVSDVTLFLSENLSGLKKIIFRPRLCHTGIFFLKEPMNKLFLSFIYFFFFVFFQKNSMKKWKWNYIIILNMDLAWKSVHARLVGNGMYSKRAIRNYSQKATACT